MILYSLIYCCYEANFYDLRTYHPPATPFAGCAKAPRAWLMLTVGISCSPLSSFCTGASPIWRTRKAPRESDMLTLDRRSVEVVPPARLPAVAGRLGLLPPTVPNELAELACISSEAAAPKGFGDAPPPCGKACSVYGVGLAGWR